MEPSDTINTLKTINITGNLNESQQVINQTINIGTESLKLLQAQGETLDTIEDTLDSNKNILNKSMSVLRSMEWFGWVGSIGSAFASSSLSTSSKQKTINIPNQMNQPTCTQLNLPDQENIPVQPTTNYNKLSSRYLKVDTS